MTLELIVNNGANSAPDRFASYLPEGWGVFAPTRSRPYPMDVAGSIGRNLTLMAGLEEAIQEKEAKEKAKTEADK